MKLKTKIRARKIRPNHNVTVHGTTALGSGTPTVVTMCLSQRRRRGPNGDRNVRTGEISMTKKTLRVAAFGILCLAAATSVAQARPKPGPSQSPALQPTCPSLLWWGIAHCRLGNSGTVSRCSRPMFHRVAPLYLARGATWSTAMTVFTWGGSNSQPYQASVLVH